MRFRRRRYAIFSRFQQKNPLVTVARHAAGEFFLAKYLSSQIYGEIRHVRSAADVTCDDSDLQRFGVCPAVGALYERERANSGSWCPVASSKSKRSTSKPNTESFVPAQIHTAEDSYGTYTLTVVDYVDSMALHRERIAELDGIYLDVYGEVDARGSVAYFARMIRERAESVEYDNYHYIGRVDGPPAAYDESRRHAGRLRPCTCSRAGFTP